MIASKEAVTRKRFAFNKTVIFHFHFKTTFLHLYLIKPLKLLSDHNLNVK